MKYSTNKKFIFFHVPKVPGSTIARALELYTNANTGPMHLYRFENVKPERLDGFVGNNDVHVSASEVKKKLRAKYEKYFTFSFVRNPWDWCISIYHYISQTPSHRGFNLYNRYGNFANYVKSSSQKHLQSDWFFDKENKPCVDFIGKFETLQQDFNTICDKIGIPRQKLPHKNKSNHKHYTEYYDDETRQIVAELYAKDIDYFEYEFGE